MVHDQSIEKVGPPLWAYFAMAFLGVWQCVMATFVTDAIAGALIVILSMVGRRYPRTWLLWTISIIGIWLQFSPLVFWPKDLAGYVTNTLIGSGVMALSSIFFPMPGQHRDEEPTIPPGWDYNPSASEHRFPIAVIALICWILARYLALYQFGYIDTVWDPFFGKGTEAVLTSSVSKAFPVPDAGLGALAYTLEFFSTCNGGKARWRTCPWMVLVFAFLVIPAGIVSVILVILQPLIVGHFCTVCLITAAFVLISIPPAVDEVVACLEYLKATRWRTLFTGGECKGAKVDTRHPSLKRPLTDSLRYVTLGLEFSWTRMLVLPIAIFLMTLPYSYDPIFGMLAIVTIVMSTATHTRSARWFNIFVALALAVTALITGQALLLHLIIALLIALLSIR